MNGETPPFIALRDVWRSYGPAEAAVIALRGVSLSIAVGERVALLGRSGSGKSTLLNLLGGLDHASSGCVEVAGRDLAQLSPAEVSQYRLRSVGMIFQAFHLIAERTALQNVELPLVLAGVPRVRRRAMAAAALESVGLGHRLEHRPTQLSGGEMQRVAIARALINRPSLVLADEPTGNLDSDTASSIMKILLDHVSTCRATLVLVTHDEGLARQATNRILWLHDGQIRS